MENNNISTQSKQEKNWRVAHALTVESIGPVKIMDMAHDSVVMLCNQYIEPGQRLSFDSDTPHTPPVLTEVIACDENNDQGFTIKCKCLMGAF